MSKYILITNELNQINDAKFQIICDHFLKSEYRGDLTSVGTVSGKEKASKGRPDSFIRTPEGHYILGEYTTQSSKTKPAFLKKLQKDLKDCFNLQKFNISPDQVETIVLCNNSKTNIADEQPLLALAASAGFNLRIVGINTIAMYLNGIGKNVAKEQLGIPFETGQILDKKDFLTQYENNNIATPLTNTIYGRDNEIIDLLNRLQENAITIVKGPPGVGKSRLALQAMDQFIKQNKNYIPYYIVERNGSLIEDLHVFLNNTNQYIIFIDDANRQISNLLAVLNRNAENKNKNIKIVLTVRDYAKDAVIDACTHLKPAVVSVLKLSDSVIEQILKSPDINVADVQVLERIVELCDGNARLAIMCARVYLENNDISYLKDVSTIYDEYYSKYFKDNLIFTDISVLKTLGILSYFHAIDMRSPEDLEILARFKLSHETFIEVIQKLEDKEIVDIYMKDTVKIADQVLATYLFYKVFIVDKKLDFLIILQNYFQKYSFRMHEAIKPSVSAFGITNTIVPLTTELNKYWKQVKNDNSGAVQYLNVFGKYYADHAFPFFKKYIEELPKPKGKPIRYNMAWLNFGSYNLIERILAEFFDSEDKYEISTAIDLNIEYCRKVSEGLEEVIKTMHENFRIKDTDVGNGLMRQSLLFEKLLQLKPLDKLYTKLFYKTMQKTVLNTHFINEAYTKENDEWRLIPSLQNLRVMVWNELIKDYIRNRELLNGILVDYIKEIYHTQYIILNFDYDNILRLIKSKLNKKYYSDCIVVQQYFEACEKQHLPINQENLRAEYYTSTYSMGCILSPERYRGKDIFERSLDWEELIDYKIKEIRENIEISSLDDFKNIYSAIEEIAKYPHSGKFGFNLMTQELICGVFKQNVLLGLNVLEYYLEKGNISGFYPNMLYTLILKDAAAKYDDIYKLIKKYFFNNRANWFLAYYERLPSKDITRQLTEDLLSFYNTLNVRVKLDERQYDNFLSIEPCIYEKILTILLDKSNLDNSNKFELGWKFFQNNNTLLQTNLTLCKKAYLNQVQYHNSYDFDKSEFLCLYDRDKSFVLEFIKKIISLNYLSYTNYHVNLICLWDLDGGESAIYSSLEQFIDPDILYHHNHIGTIFFINLPEEHHLKAIELLKKFSIEYGDNQVAINLVLDIVRNSLKQYYPEIIKFILQQNSDPTFFEKLELNNNHFSSNGGMLWSDYKASEYKAIYKAIKSLPNASSYINHLEYLADEIDYEENRSKHERKLQFMKLRP